MNSLIFFQEGINKTQELYSTILVKIISVPKCAKNGDSDFLLLGKQRCYIGNGQEVM